MAPEVKSRGSDLETFAVATHSLPAAELTAPLAELMRPKTIQEFVGQEGAIGKNSILRSVLESGQTTLARIVAIVAKEKYGTRFTQLSATSSGVSEVKEVIRIAKNERVMFRRRTILFVDEIHRFNKLQQDTFLPHVEDGTITLLGATTENPSFQLNSALLSRCRVIVLEKLQSEDIEGLLRRALPRVGARETTGGGGDVMNSRQRKQTRPLVFVESAAITTLAQLCDGDARGALNGLQVAVQAIEARYLQSTQLGMGSHHPLSPSKETPLSESCFPSTSMVTTPIANDKQLSSEPHLPDSTASNLTTPSLLSSFSTPPKDDLTSVSQPASFQSPIVTVADAKESLQRSHLLYDQSGEEHYNCISALHKSMRGSDANASIYWLARMLCAGEDTLYVARRVVRFASEDIGLADPNALCQAVAAFQACQFLGMPECEVNLAQAVVYMARAPKSVEVYLSYGKAKACVKDHKGPLPSVPLHLRNAPTRLMAGLGYGKGYKYNPAFSEPVEQQYMPTGMEDCDLFSN